LSDQDSVLAELLEYVLGDGWSGTDVDIVLSVYALTHCADAQARSCGKSQTGMACRR
jgi:hypothetical protein